MLWQNAFALLVVVGAVPAVWAEDAAPGRESEAFFELKVRPILAGTCVKCHGAAKSSGGLRLDSRDAMLKGGESGPAVVPGDPQNSLMLRAIRHENTELEMPPGELLPEAVRADLTEWVAAGAKWPQASAAGGSISGLRHWAFEPLSDVAPPHDPTGWATRPVDRFIAAGLRERGLRPGAPASKRTLIRRAYFDLIGLPPHPARVESFLADDRPDAYEHLVDRLLASPQYGERWGRYWLDLARYADTAGDNSDYPIPEARLYRDYVIDAFNAGMPYDQFLQEQLAGDILAGSGPAEDLAHRVIATGFIAQAKRFGTRKLEDIHQIIEDTLNTTGQVVLGLSLRCARCHDHKYDPITSRDYYGLYGFFASTNYPFAGGEEEPRPSGFAPLVPRALVQAQVDKHGRDISRMKADFTRIEHQSGEARLVAELMQRITAAEGGANAKAPSTGSGSCGPDADSMRVVEELKTRLAAARKELAAKLKPLGDELKRRERESPLVGLPLAYAVGDGRPTDARIQKGGNPRDLGPVVPRSVPKCLDQEAALAIPKDGSGRLELARWLTNGPPSALTARVMINRIWQHHFGKPIVATPSDFGLRGAPPTHPELLEWLAREFVRSGWSLKAMHRTIMLSSTYRLSSEIDPASALADTGNTRYWRFDRRPLDAEAVRDSLLLLGGKLDQARPGAHPFPPAPSWRFTAHHQFKASYESNHRSVYLMVQRLHPHPYLALFNGPDTSMSTAVRDDSSVSIQALFLLNSPLVHDQAAGFARSLVVAEPDPAARVRLAYLKAYARPPSPAEASRVLAYVRSYEQVLAAEGVTAVNRPVESWSSVARSLLASNEFMFVD
jgi:hypothetical protein